MEKLQAKNVNHRDSISITAKIISRKYTYKVLLCKSASLVRKEIETLFNYCFVWHISYPHPPKNYHRNLTTHQSHNKVHNQCHTWTLYFLHKSWILGQMFDKNICSSSWKDSYFKSFCGISNSLFINSTISVETLKDVLWKLGWETLVWTVESSVSK